MPPPTFIGDTTTRSAPRYSSANTAPTMSMIESMAPTSCRCTFSMRHAVDGRFGLGQAHEHPVGAGLSRLAQRRPVDGGADVLEVIVLVRGGVRVGAGRGQLTDAELHGGDAALDDAVGGNLVAVDGETAERLLDVGKRHAGVDEGAEDHVAGRASETVEVNGLHAGWVSNTTAYSNSPLPGRCGGAALSARTRPATTRARCASSRRRGPGDRRRRCPSARRPAPAGA